MLKGEAEKLNDGAESSSLPIMSANDGAGAESAEDLCCNHSHCFPKICREARVSDPVLVCILNQFTWSTIFRLVTLSANLTLIYAVLYLFFEDSVLPGSQFFSLYALAIGAYLLGWALASLPYLNVPPVFGMLLGGLLARHYAGYDIFENLGHGPAAKLKGFAFTFVLLRGGLQVTTSAIWEHPAFLLNLALVPCSMETLTVALFGWAFLGFPASWALMNGCVIACISPVVNVNCVTALAERGYGEDKDIAALIFTAASLDTVHVIVIFSICFSFIFAEMNFEPLWLAYVEGGLLDLSLGIALGLGLGLFFTFFPHRSDKYAFWYRFLGLCLGSLVCTAGPPKLSMTGTGCLATIIMSLVATTGWRILSASFDVTPLRLAVQGIWHIMQPVLVGMIGAQVDFSQWTLEKCALDVACVFCGTMVRTIFAFFATFHAPFNTKERLFIAISWISKGTIQAALAPIILNRAQETNDPKFTELASLIVRMSVVSIVVLAPLGASIMMLSGPRLLNKVTLEEVQRRREISRLRMMNLRL